MGLPAYCTSNFIFHKKHRKMAEQKLDTIMELLNSVASASSEHLENGPVHPPFSELGYFGYTCLLVGTICMAVSTLYFYQAALKAGPGKMKFEVISMMVTGIATVLYMTMFSGAGKSFVKELGHDINPHDTRDALYWGRYVDWILPPHSCFGTSLLLQVHHLMTFLPQLVLMFL